jgi:hypothetical protein
VAGIHNKVSGRAFACLELKAHGRQSKSSFRHLKTLLYAFNTCSKPPAIFVCVRRSGSLN